MSDPDWPFHYFGCLKSKDIEQLEEATSREMCDKKPSGNQ